MSTRRFAIAPIFCAAAFGCTAVHAQSVSQLFDRSIQDALRRLPPSAQRPLAPVRNAWPGRSANEVDCGPLAKWLENLPPAASAPSSGRIAVDDADVLALIREPQFSALFGVPYAAFDRNVMQTLQKASNFCFSANAPLAGATSRQHVAVSSALNPARFQRNMAAAAATARDLNTGNAVAAELDHLDASESAYARFAALSRQARSTLARLAEPQKSELLRSIASAEERVALPIERQKVDGALAGPAATGDIDALARLTDSLGEPAISPVLASSRQQQREQVMGRLAGAVQQAMNAERQRVAALGTGLAGLEQGVAWQTDFKRRYASLADKMPEVSSVERLFLEQRQPRLERSQSPFQHELDASNQPGAVQARYLIAEDAKTPAGRTLMLAVERRTSDIHKWAVLHSDPQHDRNAPKSDPGEPTEGEMFDAYESRLAGVSQATSDLKQGCSNMKTSGNSADALACVMGGVMQMGGGNQAMHLTEFRKLGCARAQGRYGYVCDLIVGIGGGMYNQAMMGSTFTKMVASGNRVTARFTKVDQGWDFVPVKEE